MVRLSRAFISFLVILSSCSQQHPSNIEQADVAAGARFGAVRLGEDRNIPNLQNSEKDNAKTFHKYLGLSSHMELVVVKSRKDARGDEHVRMNQKFKGVPIWGADFIVHNVKNKKSLSGNFLSGIPDSFDTSPLINQKEANRLAKNDHFEKHSFDVGEDESSELVIYPQGEDVFLAWHVTFFHDQHGKHDPARWNYFIDAGKGKVIENFNGLITLFQASGLGGNAKFSNAWLDALDVEASGSNYVMDTIRLRLINMNHGTSGGSDVVGPLNPIGDAPINDAHGYAEVVLNMLNDWFLFNSINNAGFKIKSRVHYGSSYENAFWDGTQMTYGDGATNFYPLSGALDVVSHEIAHGFTSFNSNLVYSGQSGGMNESFSDIAGNTAEWFAQPTAADFDVGEDIKKTGTALRYMCDPPLDGKSIDHMSQYSGQDVHYTSGIMNKAFCRAAKRFSSGGDPLGTANPLGVKRVATAFYEANDKYWISSSTFSQGGDGTIDAATALGFSTQELSWLSLSWQDVGVPLSTDPFKIVLNPSQLNLLPGDSGSLALTIIRRNGFPDPITLSILGLPASATASFDPNPVVGTTSTLNIQSLSTLPYGVISASVKGESGSLILYADLKLVVAEALQNSISKSVSGLNGSWKYYRVNLANGTTSLKVITSGGSGDGDLYIKYGSLPTTASYNCGSASSSNTESCTINSPNQGDWYVGIYAYSNFSGMVLTPTWTDQYSLSSLSLNPLNVLGGTSSVGTVAIGAAAPVGGITITLSRNNAIATLPASVVIPEGSNSAQFSISTGTVTSATAVTITASGGGAIKGATLNVLPMLSSVTVSSSVVVGGNSTTGTVTLLAPAPSGGAVVSLSSQYPTTASVPSSVTIPEGTLTATFSIITTPVTLIYNVTISAVFAGASKFASLSVRPWLSAVQSSAAILIEGQTSTGTVVLNGPATSGGIEVPLSSSNPIASVPASVTIPQGMTSATFPITTGQLPSSSSASTTISAIYTGVTKSVILTINPNTVSSVALGPTVVFGAANSTLTIFLIAPAPPGGLSVSLSSNNSAASVPSAALIPAGSNNTTVVVSTSAVSTATSATISAIYNGVTKAAVLTINPITVSSVTLGATSVFSGSSLTGTIFLNAPAPPGGLSVSLSSSDPVASVPPTVLVPAGNLSATFIISTNEVSVDTSVTIMASYNGNSVNANLLIRKPIVQLSNGVTIPDLSGSDLSWQYFRVSLPPGTVSLQIETFFGLGNADLYLKSGDIPTTTSHTCRSSNFSNYESCSSVISGAGDWYVGIYGITSYSGLSLKATWIVGPSITALSVNPSVILGGSLARGRVDIDKPAPAGGTIVHMSSNNPAVSVASAVTILEGQIGRLFDVSTSFVNSNTSATISATLGISSRSVTLNLIPALVSFSLSPSSVIGGQSSQGLITLGGPAPSNGITVQLSSNNAAALVTPTVTVPAGAASASFNVNTNTIASATTAIISATYGVTKTASLFIGSVPSVSISNSSVLEGDLGTVMNFTVSLSGAANSITSVNYSTAPSTATAGVDFISKTGTLSFNVGEISKTIAVSVVGDIFYEIDEIFLVKLSNPVGLALGNSSAQGSILNDDPAPPSISINGSSRTEGNSGVSLILFTISLSGISKQIVFVNYATVAVTALSGIDFVPTSGLLAFAPGELSKTINVSINGDIDYENDEYFNVNLSAPINASIQTASALGLIGNDDPIPGLSISDTSIQEGGAGNTFMNFTVSLSAKSKDTVYAQFVTDYLAGTATAGSDYEYTDVSISFAPGEILKTISVPIYGDDVFESNETVMMRLLTISNATTVREVATGIIVNDDTVPAISIADASVLEGSKFSPGQATVKLTLSKPYPILITVNYATANGSASASSDYIASSGNVTFAPGTTSANLILRVVGDQKREANETFTVNLSSPTNASITDGQALVTILNDD